MTNAQTQKQLPNFEKYQYAGLAARLMQSKTDSVYMAGALEQLVGTGGLNLGEDARVPYDAAQVAYNKGQKMALETSVNIWNGQFEKKRSAYKPSELASWYESALTGLSKEEKESIIEKLGEHKDETYGSIMKKVAKANHIAEGESVGANSKEEIKKAKKTIKKYEGIVQLMGVLDHYKFEQLRVKAVDYTRKRDLKALAADSDEE